MTHPATDESEPTMIPMRASRLAGMILAILATVAGHALRASPPTVVCFGDSITRSGYPEILGKLLGVEAINAGVSGHSTRQALRRIANDVLAKQPRVVVVLFGTNDLRADSERAYVSVDAYEENLNSIAQQCEDAGAGVVIGTLPPIDPAPYFERHAKDDFDRIGGLDRLVHQYRDAAIRVAEARNLPLVDLNALLASEGGWMSRDGVHPTAEGRALIAKHVSRRVLPLVSKARASQPERLRENLLQADIVVYGGTSAGIAASVQASRMGKSVILIEPSEHLGGLTTGGLGATDIGNKDVIGGISREFYERVAQHYLADEAWTHETRDEFFELRSKRTKLKEILKPNPTMWTFEPHVADTIFRGLLEEAGIEPIRGHQLVRVDKDGNRITNVTLDSGTACRAKAYIDATYEGDLMARAGVTYRVGREANSEYNETLNGIRDKTPKNQLTGSIDPYNTPGDPSSGLLPLIAEGDGGAPGEGDHRVQAYNFRLCFTDVPSNRLQVKRPPGYDPDRYELAARRAEAIVAAGVQPHIKQFCNPVWMPNRKTDINNSQGISTDFIGENYEYPDADYKRRAEIWAAHEDYVRGFWYFMSNCPRVPEGLRREFQAFGPCKDEFRAKGGWSPQLYVREARRMVSSYVMTEHNCRSKRVAEDAVGMAAYGMDSHNCQRIVKNGVARNEGDVQVHGLRPYPVSYRSIIPERDECENLAVPVCVSATHIAFGSIRMEPVFMVLGQSAAVASAIAIENEIAMQDVEYKQLRELLLAAGQVLERPVKRPKK